MCSEVSFALLVLSILIIVLLLVIVAWSILMRRGVPVVPLLVVLSVSHRMTSVVYSMHFPVVPSGRLVLVLLLLVMVAKLGIRLHVERRRIMRSHDLPSSHIGGIVLSMIRLYGLVSVVLSPSSLVRVVLTGSFVHLRRLILFLLFLKLVLSFHELSSWSRCLTMSHGFGRDKTTILLLRLILVNRTDIVIL